MSKHAAPAPPYVPARHHGGKQTPKALVIHGTVSSDNPGTARGIANWWHGPTSPVTSAHYVVDPRESIQCVYDHTVAYHCGYNTGSIAIELCDEETGPARRWQDKDSLAILHRAATLAAQLCLAYGIDPVRPSVADLKRKGPHGIYGHNDSRLAFGHTTHSDPLDFPWSQFLNYVRAEINALKGAKAPAVVKVTKAVKKAPELPRGVLESGDYRMVSQNVCALPLMSQAKVEHDVKLTASQAGVIGWQEIGPMRYKDAVRKLGKGWTTYFARPKDTWYDSPISWRHDHWDLLDKGYRKVQTAKAHVAGPRYMTWVLLRSKRTGGEVLFTNVHMIPKAFNGKTDYAESYRRAEYARGIAEIKAFVNHFMTSKPHVAVVGFGDYNKRRGLGNPLGRTIQGRRIRNLVGKSSIDLLWVVNSKDGKTRLITSGWEILGGRHSDHQGRRGHVAVRTYPR